MKQFPIFLFLAVLLVSCGETNERSEESSGTELSSEVPDKEEAEVLDRDLWRVAIDIGEEEIPFDLVFERGTDDEIQGALIENGEEKVAFDAIITVEDSLMLPFSVFASELRVRLKDGKLAGTWFNDARSNHNRLPISGYAVEKSGSRFLESSDAPPANFTGQWEVEFVYKETEKSKAIGVFEQQGRDLKGTFRTETGDYRYLVGSVYGREMKLSTFDGAHAFLFHAEKLEDGSLKGEFYSGAHWFESWTAVLNPEFTLGNPDSLTFMKDPQEEFQIAFVGTDGRTVKLSDEQYLNQPTLVQIMGTWCPNCKDQTAWLNEVNERHTGIQVLSLAFELTTDTAVAFRNINRLKDHFDLSYDVLFAGRAGRKTASAALPQLNHVMSYPTLLFLDREHRVQRIYTGFNGPATGAVYEKLVESLDQSIRQLLQPS